MFYGCLKEQRLGTSLYFGLRNHLLRHRLDKLSWNLCQLQKENFVCCFGGKSIDVDFMIKSYIASLGVKFTCGTALDTAKHPPPPPVSVHILGRPTEQSNLPRRRLPLPSPRLSPTPTPTYSPPLPPGLLRQQKPHTGSAGSVAWKETMGNQFSAPRQLVLGGRWGVASLKYF